MNMPAFDPLGLTTAPYCSPFEIPKKKTQRDVMDDHSSDAFRSLQRQIEEFQGSLDSGHEVGAHLSSFGQHSLIHVRDIHLESGDVVVIEGRTEAGDRVRLIQHLHQLSILLVAAQKIDETPHRIMGFVDTNE